MRTTVRLDDELAHEAKRHALETGRSFTQLLRDAVVALLERERGAQTPRVALPTYGGTGLLDGVDPDDLAGLRDRMDGLA